MEKQEKRSKNLVSNASFDKRTSKTSQLNEGRPSARWDDFSSLFIELCEEEIGKGNRSNGNFNVNGWKNINRRFKEITGQNYAYKQHKKLRDHWDAMKKDWTLFKKLMNKEEGVGWNAAKNSLDASDEWWESKLKENGDYGKFRNKDLTMIWFRYDRLFSDIAVTGERAKAPKQVCENEINLHEEVGDKGESNHHEDERVVVEYKGESTRHEEEPVEMGDKSESNQHEKEPMELGDSDDFEGIGITEYSTKSGTKETSSACNEIISPPSDTIKRKFRGENDKGKKKVSGPTLQRKDIHSVIQLMANKSIVSTLSTDITIGAAIQMLNNALGMTPGSEFWNFSCNLLSKKDMREVFACQPCDESRLSWLHFNYEQFKKS